MNLPQSSPLANLPLAELEHSLTTFLEPLARLLPDRRLVVVLHLALRGLLASREPVITRMASHLARAQASPWALCKRFYRWLDNPRFSHRLLRKGMAAIARREVARTGLSRLVIALDPVNLEKPYTRALEGVSVVHKATPPGPGGQARLTAGYPALAAVVVNTPRPVPVYAHLFSYTVDFRSQNRELRRAVACCRAVFPDLALCLVADAGLDDQKVFTYLNDRGLTFIIRAAHLERLVEVYNSWLQRWERERLGDLTASLPLPHRYQALFHHAGQSRPVQLRLGWLPLRLAEGGLPVWAVVVEEEGEDEALVLLTNRPVTEVREAQAVFADWQRRSQIEHFYRFDQEDGLRVESMQVASLERLRRLFLLVLLAAAFVYHLEKTWPSAAVRWLRRLGGKLGLGQDRDGPYLLLAGVSAVLTTWATLSFAALDPFRSSLRTAVKVAT